MLEAEKQLKKLEKRNQMEGMKTEMELKSKNVYLMRRLHEERREAALEERLARVSELRSNFEFEQFCLEAAVFRNLRSFKNRESLLFFSRK